MVHTIAHIPAWLQAAAVLLANDINDCEPTLDDFRKVERLRALRDDPATSPGEKANAQAKLDEIEKEVGPIEPDTKSARSTASIRDAAKRATKIILTKDLGDHVRLQKIIIHALVTAYGADESRLQQLLKLLADATRKERKRSSRTRFISPKKSDSQRLIERLPRTPRGGRSSNNCRIVCGH